MQGQFGPQPEIQDHISNMFFYLEGLMAVDDLEINPELAKQIIDLYCDIKMLSGNVDAITDPKEKQEAYEFAMLM